MSFEQVPKRHDDEGFEEVPEQDSSQTDELLDDTDNLLDDIDDILESDAEIFIDRFVQQGGE